MVQDFNSNKNVRNEERHKVNDCYGRNLERVKKKVLVVIKKKLFIIICTRKRVAGQIDKMIFKELFVRLVYRICQLIQ